MKIKINNYQAIIDTTLEIKPGLTAIIGPTNSGKSSIIRAIKGAINNQAGNTFINYDANQSIVEIIDGENTISWIKSRKGPAKYIINGDDVAKIGRSQNEEVAELLNMEEVDVGGTNFRLNFWDQMEKAFLMDRSPNQLFNFISQSKEQDLVTDLTNTKKDEHTTLTKDSSDKTIAIDVLKKEVEADKQELKLLEPFLNFDLETFERATNIHTQIKDLSVSKANLKETVNTLRTDLTLLELNQQKLLKIYNEVENKQKEITGIETKQKEIMFNIDKQINSQKYINTCKADINSLEASNKVIEKTLEKLSENLKQQTKAAEVLHELNSIISRHSVISQTIETTQTKITELQESTKLLEQELSKIDVCPFCGSNLQHGTHSH